jgi:hypothetical protein
MLLMYIHLIKTNKKNIMKKIQQINKGYFVSFYGCAYKLFDEIF